MHNNIGERIIVQHVLCGFSIILYAPASLFLYALIYVPTVLSFFVTFNSLLNWKSLCLNNAHNTERHVLQTLNFCSDGTMYGQILRLPENLHNTVSLNPLEDSREHGASKTGGGEPIVNLAFGFWHRPPNNPNMNDGHTFCREVTFISRLAIWRLCRVRLRLTFKATHWWRPTKFLLSIANLKGLNKRVLKTFTTHDVKLCIEAKESKEGRTARVWGNCLELILGFHKKVHYHICHKAGFTSGRKLGYLVFGWKI